MLPESKIMSFMDNKSGYVLHFFEGQKLIHDLAIIHNLKGVGFRFLRDAILGSQLLSVFLKERENFGFYIDSEDPYFRFKIETNSHGYMRTLLLPEDFNSFSKRITGVYRISKLTKGVSHPYNSLLEIKNRTLEEIINLALTESFQVNSRVYLAEESDQSILTMRLPNTEIDKVDQNQVRLTQEEFWSEHSPFILETFSRALTDRVEIEKVFTEKGFNYLGSKDVQFSCSCSRERMVTSIISLLRSTSKEEVFQGESFIEAKCDYCKTFYKITEEELENL